MTLAAIVILSAIIGGMSGALVMVSVDTVKNKKKESENCVKNNTL